jgi:hypothetical protein
VNTLFPKDRSFPDGTIEEKSASLVLKLVSSLCRFFCVNIKNTNHSTQTRLRKLFISNYFCETACVKSKHTNATTQIFPNRDGMQEYSWGYRLPTQLRTRLLKIWAAKAGFPFKSGRFNLELRHSFPFETSIFLPFPAFVSVL